MDYWYEVPELVTVTSWRSSHLHLRVASCPVRKITKIGFLSEEIKVQELPNILFLQFCLIRPFFHRNFLKNRTINWWLYLCFCNNSCWHPALLHCLLPLPFLWLTLLNFFLFFILFSYTVFHLNKQIKHRRFKLFLQFVRGTNTTTSI